MTRRRHAKRAAPVPRDVTKLLLAEGLSPDDVRALLAPYGFADRKRADGHLQQMAQDPRARTVLASFLGDLLVMVRETAEPDRAMTHWDRYVEAIGNPVALFDYLRQSPRLLHLMCTIFGNSPYLAQTLIRDPLLVYWLADEAVVGRRPSRVALSGALEEMLGHVTATELKLDALRRFKRREMLRIGVRDLFRLASVRETAQALSDLATVLIRAALDVVQQELQARHGRPMHQDARGKLVETGFVVMALGKLGGGELNYSSDVDLIYVYETDLGRTKGKAGSLANEEYFEYLARALTSALAEPTQEGSVFRVDLRLRAEGAMGRLARPVDEYARYYRTRGEEWERLALLKAWPVAGSTLLGTRFLRMLRPFLYDDPAPASQATSAPELHAARDARAVALAQDVKRIKGLIDARMARRGQQERNVKLGTGGIREIEFLVQAIQVLRGKQWPGIRDRSTLGALARFGRQGVLSSRDCAALAEAYGFLRDVEHKLQMVHDLQTHAVPDSPAELAACAVRLGYGWRDRSAAAERFLRDYRRHTRFVRQIFERVFRVTARSATNKKAGQRSPPGLLFQLRAGRSS